MTAFLDTAQIAVQVDVGFGDAITPSSEVIELPGFLDLPRTRFRAYPKETVVAEKFQAMVALGIERELNVAFCGVDVAFWHM